MSYERFKEDYHKHIGELGDKYLKSMYNNIKLPCRATMGSAGHDFFIPFEVLINTDHAVVIPTGIRCKIEDGWELDIIPRSGYGFKYGIHLANTIGLIDSDYYYSDNEGHILIKLVNDNPILGKNLFVKAGDAFCQGKFHEYGVADSGNEEFIIRNGGFGSTGN